MIKVEITDRGFAHLDAVPHRYGGQVEIYESSSAEEPSVWINITDKLNRNEDIQDPEREASAHLSLEGVQDLIDRLQWMLENHYQVKPRVRGEYE